MYACQAPDNPSVGGAGINPLSSSERSKEKRGREVPRCRCEWCFFGENCWIEAPKCLATDRQSGAGERGARSKKSTPIPPSSVSLTSVAPQMIYDGVARQNFWRAFKGVDWRGFLPPSIAWVCSNMWRLARVDCKIFTKRRERISKNRGGNPEWAKPTRDCPRGFWILSRVFEWILSYPPS